MHPRCGQLSRESERLGITREVHVSDISFRVYRFVRRFYVANQTSTTCRLRLESTVETSTPPFGRAHVARATTNAQPRVHAILATSPGTCVVSRCAKILPPPDRHRRRLLHRRVCVETQILRAHLRRRCADDPHGAFHRRRSAERVLSGSGDAPLKES
jgi:hypothetical protein